MRFDVITLFPELFAPFLSTGVTRRAYESGQVQVRLWNPRDYSEGSYRRVDDRPFGGGPGMVMMAEPLTLCLDAIRAERAATESAVVPVVLFSPIGQPLKHSVVEGWSASAGAVLLCGRYEGVDQRLLEAEEVEEVSLGDFILSGGEAAAIALLDAVVRLLPGVVGKTESLENESFETGLLEYPHYTRPDTWQGREVPEVLKSGHHAKVAAWRQAQAEEITRIRRPDLWARYAKAKNKSAPE